MRRPLLAGLSALAFAATLLAGARPAHADCNDDCFEALFANAGLEARGVFGLASVGTNLPAGGDVHLLFGGRHASLGLGFRALVAGTNMHGAPVSRRPESVGWTAFDIGGRGYLHPHARDGLFLGGGLSFAQLRVDGLGFRYGDAVLAFGEAGAEWPRDSAIRLSLSGRVDVGPSGRAAASRIPSDAAFVSATLQLGFVLSGEKFRAY